jgi:hypothetical protein
MGLTLFRLPRTPLGEFMKVRAASFGQSSREPTSKKKTTLGFSILYLKSPPIFLRAASARSFPCPSIQPGKDESCFSCPIV